MSTYPFASSAVIGSTGLVGSNILSTLLTFPSLQTTTISRRTPEPAEGNTHKNLNAILEPDSTAWSSKLTSLSPVPNTVFSALGTTRQHAGGLANQWKIDHDLNIELAKAAKEAGTKTFVFVSSSGCRNMLSKSFPYCKMKIGVEDAVKDLEFDNAVILRPGLIIGDREVPKQGEWIARAAVLGLGKVSQGWQDSMGQPAEEIARAAVRAAEIVAEGKAPSKYWTLEQADIVRLGRTEWNEKHGVKAEGEAAGETKVQTEA